MQTRIKTALDETVASFGLWQTFPGANLSRVLSRVPGVDWILVDCEHGNIDDGAMHEVVPAIAAVGVSPVVRLPGTEAWMIKRALDCGAHAILIPLLRTPKEAETIAEFAKFPPKGIRGFGSPFAMERFSPVPTMMEYIDQANDVLLTMVQIETREALESVEEIARVDGIDVLFVGPVDLSLNIGHRIVDGVYPAELMAAISRVREAAHKAGKKAGIFSSTSDLARQFASEGFDMVSAGSTDYGQLASAMAQTVSNAKRSSAPKTNGIY